MDSNGGTPSQVEGQEQQANVAGGSRWEEAADQHGVPPSTKRRSKQQAAAKSSAGSGGGSYRNLEEARLALNLVSQLVAGGGVESVAILTPYKGQVSPPAMVVEGGECDAYQSCY